MPLFRLFFMSNKNRTSQENFFHLCFCHLVFNPKEQLVVMGTVFAVPCFIVIFPSDFICSEYRLYFVHDIEKNENEGQ